MNDLVSYYFNTEEVRIVVRDDHPWWVAADVCHVLGIKNSRHAMSRLDDDEKGVVFSDTLGGTQEFSAVNESGLYTLILRSNKPEAKAFRRWVTHDVLPAIRQHGFYTVVQELRGEIAALHARFAMERHALQRAHDDWSQKATYWQIMCLDGSPHRPTSRKKRVLR